MNSKTNNVRSAIRFILALMTMFASFGVAAREAHAIPAFAREYGVPCETCHMTITRRNEFGDLFRKWGYHWPGAPESDSAARKQEPVEMAPSLFANVLPSRLPFSVIGSMSGSYVTDPKAQHPLTVASPSLTFAAGGNFGEHIGFWGTWLGQGTPNELYMHLTRLGGRRELNLMVGRFEQLTTVFKINEVFISRYALGTANINGHTVSTGRNGIEWNGMFFDRAFLAAGVVQQGEAGSWPAYYYHVGTKFGGVDYAGNEPHYDLDRQPKFTDDLVINLDHWGYHSTLRAKDGADTVELRRLGLDLKVRYREAAIWAGTMVGSDVDLQASRSLKSFTAFGEASYQITSWLTALYLYQYQDQTKFTEPVETHDGGFLFLPYQNVRVRAAVGHSSLTDQTAALQVLFGM